MNKEDICFMPACEMKERISSQELTSLEISDTIIERIEQINPKINALSTLMFSMVLILLVIINKRTSRIEEI